MQKIKVQKRAPTDLRVIKRIEYISELVSLKQSYRHKAVMKLQHSAYC